MSVPPLAFVLASTVAMSATAVATSGCPETFTPLVPGETRCVPSDGPLDDDFERYRDDAGYRCAILKRDLIAGDNAYGVDRRVHYSVPDESWDALPAHNPASRPLFRADIGRIQDNAALPFENITRLVPAQTPATDDEWIALGRRVFFEYPLRASATYEAIARLDALEEVGFIVEEGPTPDGDRFVGLRAFIDDHSDSQRVRVGLTCAQCHSSRDEFGVVTGQRANRAMDIGRARVLAAGFEPGNLPPELDSTKTADYDRLGPGRADVLSDDLFNPYAFPDFGGLAQMPFLHHNANWANTQVATLAVRCETLYITSSSERTRPPRVLTWALAKYIRSLEASAPLDATPAPEAARGAEVFEEHGCNGCHVPPLYTSARRVPTSEVGTDASAAESFPRYSGGYRIPTLRGIGRLAPYLHHGAFSTLDEMFDPARLEAPDVEEDSRHGHPFGLSASREDRAALIAFLRSL